VSVIVALGVPMLLLDLEAETETDNVFVIERDCDCIGVFDGVYELIILMLAV